MTSETLGCSRELGRDSGTSVLGTVIVYGRDVVYSRTRLRTVKAGLRSQSRHVFNTSGMWEGSSRKSYLTPSSDRTLRVASAFGFRYYNP